MAAGNGLGRRFLAISSPKMAYRRLSATLWSNNAAQKIHQALNKDWHEYRNVNMRTEVDEKSAVENN